MGTFTDEVVVSRRKHLQRVDVRVSGILEDLDALAEAVRAASDNHAFSVEQKNERLGRFVGVWSYQARGANRNDVARVIDNTHGLSVTTSPSSIKAGVIMVPQRAGRPERLCGCVGNGDQCENPDYVSE